MFAAYSASARQIPCLRDRFRTGFLDQVRRVVFSALLGCAIGVSTLGQGEASTWPAGSAHSGLGTRPPTIGWVGDSITSNNSPYYTSAPLATVTAVGDTALHIPAYWGTLLALQSGDTVFVCNAPAAANSAATVCESHVISSGWAGSGSGATTIPITAPIVIPGLNYANFYASRLPIASPVPWLDIALARLGGALILGGGCQNIAPLGYLDCSGIIGRNSATSSQIMGLAPYTQVALVGTATCAGCAVTADHVAAMISTGVTFVGYLGGTNDCLDGVAAATPEANATAAINEIVAAGRIALIGTLPPSVGTQPGSVSQCIYEYNRWVRQQGRSGKVIVVDFNKYLVDPMTGYWITAGTYGNATQCPATWDVPAGVCYSTDGIHPNTWSGAWAMASALVEALESAGAVEPFKTSSGAIIGNAVDAPPLATYTVNFDLIYSSALGGNPLGNMVNNGGMSNAIGACTSGTFPDDWCGTGGGFTTIHALTGSGSSATNSVVKTSPASGDPYSRSYWNQFALVQGTGTDYGSYALYKVDQVTEGSGSLGGGALGASTYIPGVTQIYIEATFKITCQAAGANSYMMVPGFEVQWQNGTTNIGDTEVAFSTDTLWTGTGGGSDPTACLGYGVIRSAPLVVPLGTTNFQAYIIGTGIGTMQFTNVNVRAWP
jgi:lysophospholipase L1-like esterase